MPQVAVRATEESGGGGCGDGEGAGGDTECEDVPLQRGLLARIIAVEF